MNWGRTLKKLFLKNGFSGDFVKRRENAADRNQWRAICGFKGPSVTKMRHQSSLDNSFVLSSDSGAALSGDASLGKVGDGILVSSSIVDEFLVKSDDSDYSEALVTHLA
jgi:hypothetical protein